MGHTQPIAYPRQLLGKRLESAQDACEELATFIDEVKALRSETGVSVLGDSLGIA